MSSTLHPLPRLAPRRPESHKGDFGRVLLIGGSRGMAGAIALSAMAALRSGAGLVRVATADPCADLVASFEPSYMTLPLPADKQGRIAAAAADLLVDAAAEADVVAMGPGLGRSPELTDLVDRLFRQVAAPMVVDADALNALADLPAGLPTPGGPRVLTPHPGEFRRLSGLPRLTPDEAPRVADQRAAVHGVVIVLKSHRTTVTDGVRRVVNTTGNPGMATGGSGDVLTGVIAGLIGQQHSPFDAAHLGVHLHGRAGDLAAAELGETSLIASDLLRWLPAAFREHAGRCQTPPPEE